MRRLLVVFAVIAATLVPVGHPRAALSTDAEDRSVPLRLWYTSPAANWESWGLPIGNGAMGGVVFGAVNTERIQFNEKTLWSGGPAPGRDYTNGNWREPRPDALQQARRLIDEQVQVDPGPITALLGQSKVGYGSYSTFGELRLAFGDLGPASDYVRDLDIDNAIASVSFTAGGVAYRREFFASYPDGVLVVRVTADQPGALSFDVQQTIPSGRSNAQRTLSGGRLTVAGNLDDNGLRFESQVHVTAEGGSVAPNGQVLTVSGADAVTIVLAAGTDYADTYPDYRGPDPHARVTATVDAAAAKSYAELRAAHIADYRRLFDRVELDLGQELPALPTDQLLSAYGTGTLSPAHERYLEVLYTQYGRYLLISSSRPGSLPANLQGVWAEGTSNPWGADYHVNINLQMNYWPAEVTNLAETAQPLHEFIEALRSPGRVSAREMFGADGWVVHNETNPYGFTGVHDWPTSFWFPEANGWLARHLWEHYQFTRDEAFLADTAYPVLREAAEFWLDFLVEDPRDGLLVASPSFSPEHGPYTAGAAMSQQIVWDLLTTTVAASEILGVDADFRAELRDTLARLDPGLRIGSWGQLQEWKVDIDDPRNQHRHVSHLYALHPGAQLDPRRDPELAAAARTSLEARGDGGTGWSKAWKINFWARLLDGDRAHKLFYELLTGSTLPNLWDTHPPFQIDGNFGATAGVAEMLLQSHTGVIEVLPALPAAWDAGSYEGLRARGDVEVDVAWSGGTADRITVTAGRSGPLTLRNELFEGRFRFVDATTGRVHRAVSHGDTMTFEAEAGHRYVALAPATLVLDVPDHGVPAGEQLPVHVTARTLTDQVVPRGVLALTVPDGWSVAPAEGVPVGPLRPGEEATVELLVTVGEDAEPGTAPLVAALTTGSAWRTTGRTAVTVDPPPPPPPPPGWTWISEMPFVSASNGWGPVERDQSNGETAAGDGGPLSIDGVVYRRGLGTHAVADVVLATEGRCSELYAVVGVNDRQAPRGSVTFSVVGDGQPLVTTPVLRGGGGGAVLEVDITGVDELRLQVGTGGDGNSYDHADWGDARLRCSG